MHKQLPYKEPISIHGVVYAIKLLSFDASATKTKKNKFVFHFEIFIFFCFTLFCELNTDKLIRTTRQYSSECS